MCGITFASYATRALAKDGLSDRDLGGIRSQIAQLKSDEGSERRRFESDEQHIRDLERQLQQLATQNQKLSGTAQELATTNKKLKTDTDREMAERYRTPEAVMRETAVPARF